MTTPSGLWKRRAIAKAAMAESEQNYLLELWEKNIGPNCGKKIPERTGVEAEGKVRVVFAV